MGARAATAQFSRAAATCNDRNSLTSPASARFSDDTNDTVRMESRAALASVIANGSGLSGPGRGGTAAVTSVMVSGGSSA